MCLQYFGLCANNYLWMKREDLIPYSFGGNKVRKAVHFFKEIDKGRFDTVVTYGSGSSNHCRVVANMAAERCIECYIISPEETIKRTFNTIFMELFGAKMIVCPIEKVHDTIEKTLGKLKSEGKKPYFIPGGGHGNLGTKAYVDCFHEIRQFEKENGIKFDYIFHASGTGTTQAGLICGRLLENDPIKIIGISIARKKPYGRDVVVNSVKDYITSMGMIINKDVIEEATNFDDSYVCGGYGKDSERIRSVIKNMFVKYGVPMDNTYVGKAYAGMLEYIKKHSIRDKKILFIHTGGAPLFFDIWKETNNEI